MKKRILSVIFAAFMLSACAFGFAACGEQTTIGAPQDNETEQGDHGDNTQGGGIDDTQSGNEPTVRTTVTEEEWNAALRMALITGNVRDLLGENMSYVSRTVVVSNDGNEYPTLLQEYRFDENKYYAKISSCYESSQVIEWEVEAYGEILTSEDSEETVLNVYRKDTNGQWRVERQEPEKPDELNAAFQKWLFQKRYAYDLYSYNAQLQQYEVSDLVIADMGEIIPGGYREILDFIGIQFENGKVVRFEVQSAGDETSNMSTASYAVATYTYGTTSVTLPEVSAE